MELNVNDVVHYASTGICKIEDIENKKVGRQFFKYYILQPIFSENNKVFVPVANDNLVSKIRRIVSKEEIKSLADEIDDLDATWIVDQNEREQYYKDVIVSGDRNQFIKMYAMIIRQNEITIASGKKVHAVDEKYLKEVRRLIFDEFAFVLGKTREETEEIFDTRILA